MKIDAGTCTNIIASLPEEPHTAALEVVKMIEQGSGPPTLDKQGRFHTPVTSLKRELRAALRIHGESPVYLDVANSQPLCIAAALLVRLKDQPKESIGRPLYKGIVCRDCQTIAPLKVPPTTPPSIRSPMDFQNAGKPFADRHLTANSKVPEFRPPIQADVAHYIALCEQGKLYEFLMEATGWTGDRDRWKYDKWFPFLYGRNARKNFRGRPVAKAFASAFPTVYQFIRNEKKRDYRRFSLAMQRAESRLVIEGVCAELAAHHPNVPVVTIHDAILTTPAHVGLIEGMMRKHFGFLNIKPTLKSTWYGQTVERTSPAGQIASIHTD